MASEVMQWDRVVDVSDNLAHLFWLANSKFMELGKVTADAMVLDLGCGTGSLSARVAEIQASGQGKVIGIDTCAAMIDGAKAKVGERPNLKFYVHDAQEQKFKDDICDVIYSRMALPFFDDPDLVLSRSFSVLKPGGRFVFMGIGGREHNDFFMAAAPLLNGQMERHLALADQTKLRHKLEAAGLDDVKTRHVRALIKLQDPQAYWSTLRGLFGIPDSPMPTFLSDRARAGQRLSVELVFAMGQKPDPSAKARYEVKRLDDMVAIARRKIQELTPYEVKRNLKRQNVVYLDVREPDEYRQGRIKEALQVPRTELETQVAKTVPDPATPIVTFCQRGIIGALAAARLQQMGYQNVWNLYGGITSWKEDGLPVEEDDEG